MDKKRLYAIFAIIFTNILGAGMILPVLPLYAVGHFEATVFQAAVIATAYFAAQFIAAPWLGRLSDRLGRRPVLIGSQIGTVLSFIMFIYAEELGNLVPGLSAALGVTGGLVMLYAARILDGITGGNITTAQAYVSDVTTPETRTQALGLLSGAFGLGFIFGPALGGVLSGYHVLAPFWGAVVITVGTLLLTTFILDESLPPEKRETAAAQVKRISVGEALQNRTFLFIALAGFFQILAFSAIPPTFALYGAQVLFPDITDPNIVSRNVGLMLALVGMVQVVTQTTLIKRLVKRFGEHNLVLIGQSVLMLAFAIFPLSTQVWWAAMIMIPNAFGRAITDPSLQSLVTSQATNQTRGRYLGIYQSAVSLGFIFGPIWSGWVFQNISPAAVYHVGAFIVAFAVMIASVLRRRIISTTVQQTA